MLLARSLTIAVIRLAVETILDRSSFPSLPLQSLDGIRRILGLTRSGDHPCMRWDEELYLMQLHAAISTLQQAFTAPRSCQNLAFVERKVEYDFSGVDDNEGFMSTYD